jgi:hypothetical protein
MKKIIVAVALVVGVSMVATGCMHPRMVGPAVGAAFVGGAVVGAAAVAVHRAHFHHYNCGCPRHWHGGRWVYYYEGSYEYWDPNAGVWYRH